MLDYRKINRENAANTKTHLSTSHNSLHSQAGKTLFHYALTHTLAQASQGFVQIARKGKCSTPDLPSLKEVMRSSKASEWKEAIQKRYDLLIENGN